MLKKFFEWLYFPELKTPEYQQWGRCYIQDILSPFSFRMYSKGQFMTVTVVWNLARVRGLIRRLFLLLLTKQAQSE